MAKKSPQILVVVDNSEEMHQALKYACSYARLAGGKVCLYACVEPAEFEYWAGVGELMRAEAREQVEASMATHADYAKRLTGEIPILYVREGEVGDELLELIAEEEGISLLVLGANTESDSAGPIVTFMMSKGAARCRVPISVVPGNLSDEQIDALF